MNFGKNLRYLRHKNKMSQEYLAEKLRYKNYTTVQKWECGKSEPNMHILKEIANLFNIDMNSLINDNLEEKKYYHKNIDSSKRSLEDESKLLNSYNEISKNENLSLIFDNIKGLSSKDLERILTIIKGIRAERGLD